MPADAVQAGELLIELDATQALADTARVGEELVAARWEVARAWVLQGAVAGGRLAVLAEAATYPAFPKGGSLRERCGRQPKSCEFCFQPLRYWLDMACIHP